MGGDVRDLVGFVIVFDVTNSARRESAVCWGIDVSSRFKEFTLDVNTRISQNLQ